MEPWDIATLVGGAALAAALLFIASAGSSRRARERRAAAAPRFEAGSASFDSGGATHAYGPILVDIEDPLPPVNVEFTPHGDQGALGEAMTAILMAVDGWKEIPAFYDNYKGIDGLFVRSLEFGAEAVIIESKTNTSTLSKTKHGRQMSDCWVADRLEQSYVVGVLPEKYADSIMQAHKHNSLFLRKELWSHDLRTGITTVSALDADANITSSRTNPADLDDEAARRQHYRFMETVTMAFNRFDWKSHYLTLKPR